MTEKRRPVVAAEVESEQSPTITVIHPQQKCNSQYRPIRTVQFPVSRL